MLRAFKRLLAMDSHGERREGEHPVLLIAGHGRLRKQLVATASELGLENHVRFLGMRRDVDALMNAADAYVMSSAWEGTPLALLEAAATGLPIVATEVGGNGDVVLDGRSGRLVPPHETEALAAAMHSLGELSLEERRQFGMRGREYVCRHYSVEKVVDRFEEILSGLDRGGSR
jgi:glycosyltransferase involved in cell wall biosynthesis